VSQSTVCQSLGDQHTIHASLGDFNAPDYCVGDDADYQYRLPFSIKRHLELVTTSLGTSAVMKLVHNYMVTALHSETCQGKSVVMELTGLCTSHL